MTEQVKIGDILLTSPRFDQYSDKWLTKYTELDAQQKHLAAVTVALELIRSDVSSASEKSTGLESHLYSLEGYVSKIKHVLDAVE